MKGTLAIPQTQNSYVYTLNNPVNLSDPSGESPLLVVGACLVVGAQIYELVNASNEYKHNKDATLSNYSSFPEYWGDVRFDKILNNDAFQLGYDVLVQGVGQESQFVADVLEYSMDVLEITYENKH